jgi:hypothetical protein
MDIECLTEDLADLANDVIGRLGQNAARRLTQTELEALRLELRVASKALHRVEILLKR